MQQYIATVMRLTATRLRGVSNALQRRFVYLDRDIWRVSCLSSVTVVLRDNPPGHRTNPSGILLRALSGRRELQLI